MSKDYYLKEVKDQIGEKSAEIARISSEFQQFAEGVNAKIREVLQEAGVWEQVQKLNTDRDEKQNSSQKQVDLLQDQIRDLKKVGTWLETVEEPAAPCAPRASGVSGILNRVEYD